MEDASKGWLAGREGPIFKLVNLFVNRPSGARRKVGARKLRGIEMLDSRLRGNDGGG